MTCKDCIHCDVCSDWEDICNKMSPFSTIKKGVCKDFKNRSKMMELPDVMYIYQFNNDNIAVPVMCGVISTSEKFIKVHLSDGRILNKPKDSIGKTIFYTLEDVERKVMEVNKSDL